MILKFIGGILLTAGMVMGASLLALPAVMGELGFLNACIVLILAWFIMTIGALYLLELTHWFPQGANFITLSRNILGKRYTLIVWFIYVLLKYAVISAYISAVSDVITYLLGKVGVNVDQKIVALFFVLIMGILIYKGIKNVDLVNRMLMLLQFILLFTIITFCLPYIKFENLSTIIVAKQYVLPSITIAIASFGFAAIVPSLYNYFNGNAKKVQTIIIIGTAIPLIIYIAWNFIIIGMLGRSYLAELFNSGNTVSCLIRILEIKTNSLLINPVFKLFSTLCILTSYLGISLAFVDFLIDGFRFNSRNKKGRSYICLMAFFPPILIVLIKPEIFIAALSCAGVLSTILLMLLPSLMVLIGRNRKNFANVYRVFGGRILIVLILSISIILIAYNIFKLVF